MIEFISGACVGVCLGVVGLFVVAWRLVGNAPKAKPQGLAATSVSVNGGGTTLDAYHARMMRDVLKHYEGQA
jgi:hypothetical protein